ncbi:M15 family metallopeptidase [Catellatospora sp. KI3]|uniref:M15 family metallopeptidase n=1 Tax=Catellatospora sp. KI3 TaxID=3041620 RepID=UPI002482F267|nr:M15 family metallopeptidase [Catellatospora sp. KI3]MDI1461936.1 M15 family metallopeptidase [Catellatospora sp. KI3]
MAEMVLLSDAAVVQTPVTDCQEALIDLRTVGALRLDDRLADPDGAFAHVRLSVVDRLVTAQTLLPSGLRLLIVECYRPMRLQREYFDAHKQRLRGIQPGRDDDWYHRRASRYISPPEVAPHVAGAAVDLTLCTADGTEIWMGTQVNDTDSEACHTDSANVSAEAARHRRILGDALTSVGMVNYPTEWWHWSYGDRYWAHVTGAASARYGPVESVPVPAGR